MPTVVIIIYYLEDNSGGLLVLFDKNKVATIREIVSWVFGCAVIASGFFTHIDRYVSIFIEGNLI